MQETLDDDLPPLAAAVERLRQCVAATTHETWRETLQHASARSRAAWGMVRVAVRHWINLVSCAWHRSAGLCDHKVGHKLRWCGEPHYDWVKVVITAMLSEFDVQPGLRQLERELDRLLDEHGATLRDEPGIGPIAAATLLAEVGDPFRFARESMFARWWPTGPAPPRLRRQPADQQRALHRQRHPTPATSTRRAPTSTARSAKARPREKHAEHTNDTSPTESSAACGTTSTTGSTDNFNPPLDKGASDSPDRHRQ